MHTVCKHLITTVAALLLTFTGCTTDPQPVEPGTNVSDTTADVTTAVDTTAEDTTTPPETEAPVCEHVYTETVEMEALALRDGLTRFTCDECGDSYTETIPATKSLKILAIGNSFSQDSVEYLWDICKSGGVEDVTLGHLSIGGCSLATHYRNMSQDIGAYNYYKNTTGKMVQTKDVKVSTALKEEEWDFIVIQQVSGQSGQPDTYSRLPKILTYLEENKTNEDAKILWHMTWAYQGDSTHADFKKYDSDQMTMYNAILDTVKEKVLTNESIDGVIPNATSIQNLRTSLLGDTVTRDGYHLSLSYGRYTAALTWFAYVTGGSPDSVTYIPPTQPVIKKNIHVLQDAVASAIANPYEVTPSNYPAT